jgi:RIO kinase 1
VAFTPEAGPAHHATLMAEVVRMLCAGWCTAICRSSTSCWRMPTADGTDVPVIIDLPQAVDAAGNNHAQRMLLRDVANLRDFFGQFAPELLATAYGPEIWTLYQAGLLTNDTVLTGRYTPVPAGAVDLTSVLREIDDARAEDAARRLRMARPSPASRSKGRCRCRQPLRHHAPWQSWALRSSRAS